MRRAYEKDKAEHELFREQMQASIISDRGVFDAEVRARVHVARRVHGTVRALYACCTGAVRALPGYVYWYLYKPHHNLPRPTILLTS